MRFMCFLQKQLQLQSNVLGTTEGFLIYTAITFHLTIHHFAHMGTNGYPEGQGNACVSSLKGNQWQLNVREMK